MAGVSSGAPKWTWVKEPQAALQSQHVVSTSKFF
jgi:hypothetical protein